MTPERAWLRNQLHIMFDHWRVPIETTYATLSEGTETTIKRAITCNHIASMHGRRVKLKGLPSGTGEVTTEVYANVFKKLLNREIALYINDRRSNWLRKKRKKNTLPTPTSSSRQRTVVNEDAEDSA